MITMSDTGQELAGGLVVGKRFHSAPVIRLADAKPMHLGHVLDADGRWRLVVFAPAGDRGLPAGPVAALCRRLADEPNGVVRRHTPPGAEIDSRIDVRAVFQVGHRELAVESMPTLLLPRKGSLGLIDYEKVFCPDPTDGRDIFDLRGIDRTSGAVVVVRPDQQVAGVLALDDVDRLRRFFDGFLQIRA